MNLREQRLYDASRAGTLRRLVDSLRWPADRAEALLAEWEAEAAARGLQPRDGHFWTDAPAWLSARYAEQRRR